MRRGAGLSAAAIVWLTAAGLAFGDTRIIVREGTEVSKTADLPPAVRKNLASDEVNPVTLWVCRDRWPVSIRAAA